MASAALSSIALPVLLFVLALSFQCQQRHRKQPLLLEADEEKDRGRREKGGRAGFELSGADAEEVTLTLIFCVHKTHFITI